MSRNLIFVTMAIIGIAMLMMGCNGTKDVPSNAREVSAPNVALYITDPPALTGLNQDVTLNLNYKNDTNRSLLYTIDKYWVSEIDITPDVKDRDPLYQSLDSYVNRLRGNGQRLNPGFYPLHDYDYDNFKVRTGEVHKGTATYHADRVGIFQIQACVELKFDDGTRKRLSSNKVEIAVLPVQNFTFPK